MNPGLSNQQLDQYSDVVIEELTNIEDSADVISGIIESVNYNYKSLNTELSSANSKYLLALENYRSASQNLASVYQNLRYLVSEQ